MYENPSYIKSNQNMKEEDPIEKLNISLNQLLFSLKNKEVFSSADIEADLNSENEDSEQIQEDEGEDLLNQFENLHNINNNNENSNKKEKNNNQIIQENNKKKISNKNIYYKNNQKNFGVLLEKIREIKNENLSCKEEINDYYIIFNQMIQVIIEGVIMKETEMNEKYQNNINELRKQLDLSNEKMNKISKDYQKKINDNLNKFNNVINNNKIEKEQIEKNFKDSINNLNQEKNKLLEEKNKLNNE